MKLFILIILAMTVGTISIKVRCYFMAYACGDCYPNYKIKEVLKGESGIKEKLLDRAVQVVFKSKKLESKIDSLTAKCAICYDYYMEGYLKYQPNKEYSLLEAETCAVNLRNLECCKD